MKKYLLIVCIGVFLMSAVNCPGQAEAEYVEGRTWVQDYGLFYDAGFFRFRYDRYSVGDTIRFREKLDLLRQSEKMGEWQGQYQPGTEYYTGYSELRWSTKAGFVHFYIYSCFPELRFMNYGGIAETADLVETMPEFAQGSPRKASKERYVKVKWGPERFLVNELTLDAFAEKAVGLYVEPEDTEELAFQRWSDFYVKSDRWSKDDSLESFNKRLTGLPEFPASFRRAMKFPIETRILTVGKRILRSDLEVGNFVYHEAATYQISLSRKNGMKKGMRFMIPGSTDEIYLTEIHQSVVTGIIVRHLDDEGNDECINRDGLQQACGSIVANTSVRTKVGDFAN